MADAVADEPPREQAEKGLAKPLASLRAAAPGGLGRRFGLAYFVLAIVFGAAVGFFVIFLQEPSTTKSAAIWSPWKPSARGLEAAQQIATHVARRYRLSGGEPLVDVLAGAPQLLNDVPITAVQIRSGFADQRVEDVKFYRTTRSVLFQLCGRGQECAISGKASVARARLLRAEILELSLYAFNYVSDIDSVIALAPPTFLPPDTQPVRTAIFLRKHDVMPELDVPLARTVPQRVLSPGALPTTVERAIDRLHLLESQFQSLQDGTAMLVLSPMAST